MNYHATAISWNNKGILFTGPPGCGKSSLAFDLIQQGAVLIADDQVILEQRNGKWFAKCPEEIRNKLHLRDIGLLHFTAQPEMKIDFIFQSDLPANKLSRAPDLNQPVTEINFFDDYIASKIKNILNHI